MLQFLILLLLPIFSCGMTHSFFPENNLDIPEEEGFSSNVTKEKFNRIIDLGDRYIRNVSNRYGETVYIERKWSSGRVNADVSRNSSGVVRVRMYGGLARHQLITPEGFAMVLSHEFAHAYCWNYNNNPVFIYEDLKLCSEGNADYDGAHMLKYIVDGMADLGVDLSYTPKMFDACSENPSISQPINCIIRLNGAQSVSKLLAELANEPYPSLERRDTRQVKRTNKSYPDTVQCRLDNMWDGIFRLPYSRCWYKP